MFLAGRHISLKKKGPLTSGQRAFGKVSLPWQSKTIPSLETAYIQPSAGYRFTGK